MSTGTPVIAWRTGSVPQIIDEGVTGFVVESIEGAMRAVEQVRGLARTAVRRRFEARFTASQMARAYIAAYERLLAVGETWRSPAEIASSTKSIPADMLPSLAPIVSKWGQGTVPILMANPPVSLAEQ